MKPIALFLLFAALFTGPVNAAHQPNQSFIYLRIYETAGIEGRVEVHVNELNSVFGLNLKEVPKPEDVTPHLETITAYLLQHIGFRSDGRNYPIDFTGEISTLRIIDGTFIRFHFQLENSEEVPEELHITYSPFFELDPSHLGMLGIEYNWKSGLINNETLIALNFTPRNTTQTLSLTDTSIWKGFNAMVQQGVWHIWIGLDHILFLLALILPSVVRRVSRNPGAGGAAVTAVRRRTVWEPVRKFRPAFLYILKVITLFTIAHTITLSLAALDVVSLPSRLVESVIALSIGLAALHNIWPVFRGSDWVIAFGFGLFHGFGFASVLGDLGIHGEFLTLTLLGFNLGVEIGQVLIIAMIFPVLYLLRKFKLYPVLLTGLSVLLIAISLYWFTERAFDINLTLDDRLRRAGYRIAVRLGLR